MLVGSRGGSRIFPKGGRRVPRGALTQQRGPQSEKAKNKIFAHFQSKKAHFQSKNIHVIFLSAAASCQVKLVPTFLVAKRISGISSMVTRPKSVTLIGAPKARRFFGEEARTSQNPASSP